MRSQTKRILFIFLMVSYYTAALAQSDSISNVKIVPNRIGFDIGLLKGYFKDLNYSPLNYTEGAPLFSLNYIRQGRDDRHLVVVDVDFAKGKMKSGVSDFFQADHTLGNVEFSFLWRLLQPKNKKWSFFLGPQYNSFIQYIDWHDQDSWTYLATHGLNLKGLARYAVSRKGYFEMSLSIPLVQLFVRPTYNGYDLFIQENSDNVAKVAFHGEVASFNQYVAFDCKTVYRYAASHRWNFVFGYLLRYQHVSGYNKLSHLQNQLTAGLAVKF